jgi:hypothetical protein
MANQVKEDEVVRMGEKIKVFKVLVGKPEGKTPLGKLSHRC